MQDSELSQNLNFIKSKFEFLSEDEILGFIKTHPWLETETDPSIIHDYLTSYTQGLAEHYNQLYNKLSQLQKQPELSASIKSNEQLNNNQILMPSEDSILMTLIMKFDEMRSFFQEINEINESKKHFSLIYNVLWKIQEFPQNPNFRQINIDPSEFLLLNYLIEILELLGFVKYEADNKISLIYTNENIPFFKNAMEYIESEYLPNPKSNLMIDEEQRTNDKTKEQANYLAKIHENRILNKNQSLNKNQTQNPSLKRNIYTFENHNFQQKQYQESQTSIQDQLKEYRNRMRQKTLQKNQFTGNNIMDINKLYTNQELQYSNNSSLQTSYKNKFVTMDDIERKRIEEDKIAFGKKALQFTNEFRKKQGKPPVEWNQHLCDIGMKHSMDMAEQRVPFGHQGFQNRASSIIFQHGAVYENVAYCFGVEDTPKVIVDGWIQSPGHRKNMLSDSNVCGIAVYRSNDGKWYFTQLFAQKC